MKRKIYVLGSINIDLNIVVEEMPKIGQTIKGDGLIQNIGGKGFNQANALATLGCDVTLIAGVGADDFGVKAQRVAQEKGISHHHIVSKSAETGIAFIIRNSQDNVIIINSGANDLVDESDLLVLNQSKESDILLAQFEVPIKTVEKAFELAKKRGMITFLNPAPAYLLTEKLYRHTDFLVLNQTEAEVITGIFPQDDGSIKESSQYLLARGIKNIIFTLSSKGSVYINQSTYLEKKSFKTKVLDTTGAGDSFIGGFIYGFVNQVSIEEALRYANASGSYTCEILGVENAMPKIDDLIRIIKKGERNNE